jgi:hypothetical protein
VTALETLAQRCEAATADEQREILTAAWEAIHGPSLVPISPHHVGAAKGWTRFQRMLIVEAYESAAMTLVPEGWQGSRLHWWTGSKAVCELVETHLVDGQWVREIGWLGRATGEAETCALALCAASLRARNAEPKEMGEGHE